MTKDEVITEAALQTGQSKTEVATAFEAIVKSIKLANKLGEGVFIRGFGSFSIVTRAAKTARNIKAGTSIQLPAKKVIKFKPSSDYPINQ
jgi:DNA-binding protein HU-beta